MIEYKLVKDQDSEERRNHFSKETRFENNLELTESDWDDLGKDGFKFVTRYGDYLVFMKEPDNRVNVAAIRESMEVSRESSRL